MKVFKRRNIDPDMIIAKTTNEAIDDIMAGVKYFMFYRPIRTTLVLLVLFGGALYTVVDVYQNIVRAKAHIEKTIAIPSETKGK